MCVWRDALTAVKTTKTTTPYFTYLHPQFGKRRFVCTKAANRFYFSAMSMVKLLRASWGVVVCVPDRLQNLDYATIMSFTAKPLFLAMTMND
jgi:hypothetical protein